MWSLILQVVGLCSITGCAFAIDGRVGGVALGVVAVYVGLAAEVR